MANTFQQKARFRKLIYAALILVLFTASLMHRRVIVMEQARDLQLLEVTRGKVDLTSSALQLILSGSRGVAVTFLWKKAIDEQARHKWNEVELLVGSITKLQPYFITPWLFQSWNLAFNVSVECDKPRDKFYYVSRGLQLLAEGESRNEGGLDKAGRPRFPGNPDMRFYLGYTYQLKIGTSDEKNAMQCLLDMTCIDPAERNPEAMWAPGKQGKEVNLEVFKEFCKKHPRLVRRISEVLDYNTPRQVVGFLKENQVLPSRFSEGETLAGKTELKKQREDQFPIIPPPVSDALLPAPLKGFWPDAANPALTSEAIDVFQIARTWFSYAQLPLPPATPDLGPLGPPFDPVKHRVPKHMTTVIFRGYPSLAQHYVAEQLQNDGWFDEEGWVIRDWFDPVLSEGDEIRVGTETKYHSGLAWKKTYDLFRDHGIKNGLYISPELHQELEKKADVYRKQFKITRGQKTELRKDLQTGPIGEGFLAHNKLLWNDYYRGLTNYDNHLFEAEAQQDSRTVLAHKLFFQGLKLARAGAAPLALAYYEQAIPTWIDVLLDYPQFRQVQPAMEDLYEAQLKYIRMLQREKATAFRTVALLTAQLNAAPPLPPFNVALDTLLDESQKLAIIPIRDFYGPIDRVMLFHSHYMTPEFKHVLLLWSQMGLPFPGLVYPGQANRLLTYAALRPQLDAGWSPLLDLTAADAVRRRIGLPLRLTGAGQKN